MDYPVLIILTMELLLALWLLKKLGLMDSAWPAAFCIVLAVGAFAIRALCLDYETLDYQNFLTKWVAFYRNNGGFAAMDRAIGNYNIPYLYFMALFSYSSIRDLYLIKLLSILFDVLLAYGCTRLLRRFTSFLPRLIGCFFAVMYLPTVVLNSALWAQCDSIYVALAVLGIVFALEERPCLSMAMIALSFGFKLQAVFVMPVYAVLWFYGKFNWKHFLLFPVFYVLLVLPAVIAGRPFMDTVLLYFSQTGSIGSALNYNSPSVFGLIRNVSDTAFVSRIAVIAAFAYMCALLCLCFYLRKRLNDKSILIAAALFAVGIPFILPHMHDRYFFSSDILTLLLAFMIPAAAPFALLAEFASILGYHAYLKMKWLLTMDHGARALIAVLMALGFLFYHSLEQMPKNAGKSMPAGSKSKGGKKKKRRHA